MKKYMPLHCILPSVVQTETLYLDLYVVDLCIAQHLWCLSIAFRQPSLISDKWPQMWETMDVVIGVLRKTKRKSPICLLPHSLHFHFTNFPLTTSVRQIQSDGYFLSYLFCLALFSQPFHCVRCGKWYMFSMSLHILRKWYCIYYSQSVAIWPQSESIIHCHGCGLIVWAQRSLRMSLIILKYNLPKRIFQSNQRKLELIIRDVLYTQMRIELWRITITPSEHITKFLVSIASVPRRQQKKATGRWE